MKFIFEGLGLTSGGGKVGALHLLPALAKQGHHEYVALLPHLPEYLGLSSPNLKVVLTPKHGNLVAREWWLNVRVPKICLAQKADGLLCFGNFAPHHPPVPTIIFLQNAYFLYRDALACRGLTLRQRLIVEYGRHHLRHLAENVAVVVQTEVMKQRLLSQYPISPSRVVVIPDGGSPPHLLPSSRVKSRETASGPFIFLCMAVYFPNKNLEILVEATKRLRALTKRPFRCLVTIHPDQHPGARKLLTRIEREMVGDVLLNVGPVPPERVPAAYGSADAFILPTLLESFGRPYGEAMHFGLPILTSDRDFAHDRCQDTAIYFDPLDADSAARAMARVMEDEELRKRLVKNGRRILAQTPTWDQIVARFVDVLERAAQHGHANVSTARSKTRPEVGANV